MNVDNSLRLRWSRLVANRSAEQKVAERLFQEITSAYTESQRHYHTLHHLNHMFNELDDYEAEAGLKLVDEILWAVWYHDVVYQPGAKTNERKSAEFARESMLKLDIKEAEIDRVGGLIVATQNHRCTPGDLDAQVFLDADMAILGSDPSRYSAYCKSVRQEHISIPDFIFYRGRKKFLSTTLEQDSIFFSGFFYRKYEAAARMNIEHELASMM